MSSQSGNHQTPDDGTAENTFALRADLLGEPPSSTLANADAFSSPLEPLPSGWALLVVKGGPNAGSRFPLQQPTTSAGRHPGADIFLDDVTVSRHHAEFRLEKGEFRIVDVGGLNGTYVNRESVESAVLANGDEIQLGKFRLVFFTAPTTS